MYLDLIIKANVYMYAMISWKDYKNVPYFVIAVRKLFEAKQLGEQNEGTTLTQINVLTKVRLYLNFILILPITSG